MVDKLVYVINGKPWEVLTELWEDSQLTNTHPHAWTNHRTPLGALRERETDAIIAHQILWITASVPLTQDTHKAQHFKVPHANQICYFPLGLEKNLKTRPCSYSLSKVWHVTPFKIFKDTKINSDEEVGILNVLPSSSEFRSPCHKVAQLFPHRIDTIHVQQ